MIYRFILTLVLLVVLVFVITKTVNLNELPNLLLNFPKLTLLELLFISSTISVLKAWRFLILLKNTSIKVSFWACLKTFIAGQAITPLPGGETIRGVLIHHETNTNILKTTGPVITQAYLELTSAAILATIGALIFKAFRIPILITLIILILLAIILITPQIMQKLVQKTTKIKFLNKFLSRLQRSQKDIKANFYDQDTGLPDKVLVQTLALSFLANFLGGELVALTAQTYNVDLGLLRSTFIYSLGMVIQGVGTFSPGGLGLTEGGMTGILIFSGVDSAQAIAIVLIFRIITLIFNIVVGSIFLTAFYSKVLILNKSK
jgi:glycosyltransferase 2 family protein